MFRKFIMTIIAIMLLMGIDGISNGAEKEEQMIKVVNKVCDRECLKGFITKYLDAMIAHKPGSLPVAEGVRFTEDCKEMRLGEGLWGNISRLTGYRRDILDVQEGVAVSFLVVEEGQSPVLFVMRLKVDDQKITEVETTVVRNQKEGMLFNLQNLQTVSEAMASFPAKERLNSREDAIRIALTYPAGLKVGSFVKVDSPMAPDAYRYENGQLMAGPGCTFFKGCENMKTQLIPTLSGITHRVVAVDEELGVVAVRMNFGPGSTFQGGDELDVWHSFKIYDGLIHAAEAYCEIVPSGTKSGWE
jgi:hypothetical protein